VKTDWKTQWDAGKRAQTREKTKKSPLETWGLKWNRQFSIKDRDPNQKKGRGSQEADD